MGCRPMDSLRDGSQADSSRPGLTPASGRDRQSLRRVPRGRQLAYRRCTGLLPGPRTMVHVIANQLFEAEVVGVIDLGNQCVVDAIAIS